MSNATAKTLTRQATGPEMAEYVESEIYQLCETIKDNGEKTSDGLAQMKFIDAFKVSLNVSALVAQLSIKTKLTNGFITLQSSTLSCQTDSRTF